METTFLESLSADEALTAIYIGYYDRAPDPVGFAFWQQTLADGFDLNGDGSSLDDIASNFSGQEETLMVHPFFSNPTDASAAAFVTEIFANLFNRAPDDAGLAFWTEALQNAIAGNGDMSVGEIILSIIAGAQTAADGGFPDQEIISNKIAVGMDWEAAVNAAGIEYVPGSATEDSARSVVSNVDETDASIVAANAAIADFVATTTPGPAPVAGDLIIMSEDGRDNLTGTEGNDTFEAFNSANGAELEDGDRLDGGAGTDTLYFHNSEQGVAAIAARTTSVEQVVVTNQANDRDADADNNVGGYNSNLEVDVELDAGSMSGVTRWEDYDSRADLVVEDARDQDDTDGTFTGDITVAMVSTDPGDVDFAVYFDQPVNTSQNFGTLEIRVLDQEAAFGQPAPSASSTGFLNESSLISFKFEFDDQEITVTLADELGVTYGPDVSFSDLLTQVQNATQQALTDAGVTDLNFSASLGAPVSVGVGNQFTLPIILTFDVTADSIAAQNDNIIVLGRDQNGNDATDTFGSLSTDRTTTEELIRLNVELDDVGKGSMGGDALFGAMSTGRQNEDQGTSDSIGIQQFDIEVDRSSQLQTINSTNNSLEVVNITNGENSGINNTTTAADEMIGDLVVRGNASPDTTTDTDSAMPGAQPQHNSYGFSDVRAINASAMVGAVDITAELTDEIVEKYLEIQDSANNGEADDVAFNYDLGSNNDEFLLNMSASSLVDAGTGSREDFNMTTSGGAGNDVITTNIGSTDKEIDNQGQDYYILTTDNAQDWYENSVSSNAATFTVNGGTGDDVIWTHGWGDATISDGGGSDVIYTDNSGVVQSAGVLTNLERIIVEHEQIDYVTGAVWAFNAEDAAGAALSGPVVAGQLAGLSGITNDTFVIGNAATGQTFSAGTATISVSFNGLSATAAAAYTSTATLTLDSGNYDAVSGDVSIMEQDMNQAMKDAINNDPVLSQVLEAIDGPGQSLIVYSKIDGAVIDATTLEVDITNVTLNNVSVGNPLANTAYTAEAFVNLGTDSDAESDNTIDVASDGANDVYVLSTNDTTNAQPVGNVGTLAPSDLNGASNETIAFDDGFGVDTVFNFDFGPLAAAGDVLDFSAITGGANVLRAFTAAGNDVVIDTIANVDGSGGGVVDGELTAAEVAAFFGPDDTTASEHILIAFDSNGQNGGEVWHITDGAASTSDATAVEEGTINLIGTDWTTLTVDNIA